MDQTEQSQPQPHHHFDWKSFLHHSKLLIFCVVFGLIAYFAIPAVISLIVPVPQVKPISSQSTKNHLGESTQRTINKLTVADVIPSEGKLIAADLVNMKMLLYQNGTLVAEYPIASKGRAGTPWETPSGFYSVRTKELSHFSSIAKVYMPYSMQFYGNYFIHGRTHYADGTLTSATFSGGCIKLDTVNAEKVFAFADVGTKVFVYDTKQTAPLPTLSLARIPIPDIAAPSYLVADIDTGDVYAEQNSQERRPIASVTKLMTALVANEIISFDKKLSVPESSLFNPPIPERTAQKIFSVNDLFYPLLMHSSNGVADAIAAYYGKNGFVGWMNTTAKALDMSSTSFADPSGLSPDNLSTTDDLFRLAAYLANKKSFVLKITHMPSTTVTADDGSQYRVGNVNSPVISQPFQGGKVGHTTAAADTLLSVISFKVGESTRRVAIAVLGSTNQLKDAHNLANWITRAAEKEVSESQAACVSCAQVAPTYRRIEL